MKFDLKKNLFALIAGVVSIGLIVATVLGFTLFKPGNVVSSSGTTNEAGNAVYTKAGVLGLFSGPVTVTGEVADDSSVFIAVGRSYDVEAYAATLKAAQIKGLKSWDELNLTEVESAKDNVTPEPAAITNSDLWSKTVSEKGKVSLTLTEKTNDLSVMIYAPDAEKQFTVNLKWTYERTIYWPWVTLALGILLLLLAIIYSLVRNKADSHKTLKVDRKPAEVAHTRSEVAQTRSESTDGHSESTDERPEVTDEPLEVDSGTTRTQSDTTTATDPSTYSSPETQSEVADQPVQPAEDDSANQSSQIDSDQSRDTSATLTETAQSEPETDSETVSTESGSIISIHAVTGEIRLPSRGALRNARARGQEKMELDGVYYPTGAIPMVDSNIEHDEPVAPIEISELLPEDVENMINSAANAGDTTGVRPDETLWDRLHRYRSGGGSSTDTNTAGGQDKSQSGENNDVPEVSEDDNE